jgi:hypothetical protein
MREITFVGVYREKLAFMTLVRDVAPGPFV